MIPEITLAGKGYPVKPLVIMQLRVVVPAIMRLKPVLATNSLAGITEEQYDDLVAIIYQSICPATPMKRDDFMNLAISPVEMLNALPVIAEQAGLVKKDADAGEAPAGNQPTGTPS